MNCGYESLILTSWLKFAAVEGNIAMRTMWLRDYHQIKTRQTFAEIATSHVAGIGRPTTHEDFCLCLPELTLSLPSLTYCAFSLLLFNTRETKRVEESKTVVKKFIHVLIPDCTEKSILP